MEQVDNIHTLYSFDKLLSQNKFGKVYLGKEMEDLKDVIIKQSMK